MDELSQYAQEKFMNCSVLIFSQTWLNSDVLDRVIELESRADRVAAALGKKRGGGVCICVNKTWCMNSVIVNTYCSSDREYLVIKYKPFYLSCEFSCIVVAVVYTHLDANTNVAIKDIRAAISKPCTQIIQHCTQMVLSLLGTSNTVIYILDFQIFTRMFTAPQKILRLWINCPLM